MKILYVSQYFPPEPGAPAARVSELARAWAALGHDVQVLTGMPNHPTGEVPDEYRGRIVVRERFHNVDVLRTWLYATPNRGKLRRSLAYGSFALSASTLGLRWVTRPDVIIATSPQLLTAVAGATLSSVLRVPWVFEVRDLWPESIVAVQALSANNPAIRVLEHSARALYRHADHIVVVTDAFKTKLAALGVPSEKIDVIKNGVDLRRFVPAPRETRMRTQLGWDDSIVASYVGTHGMAHGLDAVLDAAKLLTADERIRVLFVGEGAERARLERRAKDEGLTNVRFLGALPREAMNEVYATSDICLVPLRKSELFTTVLPSKLFEIMAMSKPILLSVDGEARTLVEEAGSGLFVPPEDSRAMADAVSALANDPALRSRMGSAGREFVIREFDRQVLAERYLRILENLAAT